MSDQNLRIENAELQHAVEELQGLVADRNARILELEGRINTPRTDEFFEAVRTEAAHQIERWGVDHDAGKRSEDWITLFMYLLGKAAKAHFDGDDAKLEHHVITSAAVALNWWRRMHGIDLSMRPGVDDTIRPGFSASLGLKVCAHDGVTPNDKVTSNRNIDLVDQLCEREGFNR